jgi:hypothetical protein
MTPSTKSECSKATNSTTLSPWPSSVPCQKMSLSESSLARCITPGSASSNQLAKTSDDPNESKCHPIEIVPTEEGSRSGQQDFFRASSTYRTRREQSNRAPRWHPYRSLQSTCRRPAEVLSPRCYSSCCSNLATRTIYLRCLHYFARIPRSANTYFGVLT